MLVKKGTKLRIADFVHGADGLGNQNFPPPNGKPIEESAADFIVEQANKYPGEVTLVALGPLTNVAVVSLLFLTPMRLANDVFVVIVSVELSNYYNVFWFF